MPLIEPIPDLRSLDVLQSVAELGSIRQAALAHRISQPAASMRLRSLEKLLNLQLLERSRSGTRLTATGTAIAQWSLEVIDSMNQLIMGAKAIRSDGQIHLRIVASMTAAEYLMPSWLNRLRASHPEIVASLRMGNSDHVVNVMHHRGADIGFVEGSHAPADLESAAVMADDLVVVVSPHHQWAKRKKPVTARDVATTPIVLRETGSGTREVLEDALSAINLLPTALVELGSTTAIKAAIATENAPGVLSRLTIRGDVEDGRLVIVPTVGLSLERSIRAIWRLDQSLSAQAKAFLRQIGAAN